MDPRIERLQRRSASDPRVIGLGGGLPSESQFPRARLAAAFATAVRGSAALQYGWPEGSQALRGFIAGRLRARGASVGSDEVLITNGAQQALAIAAQLVARRGERIGVGAESYPGALDLFRTRGTRPCSSDEDVRARYVMPAVDNPRGQAMSEAERRALVAGGRPILEDDAYAELRFAGPPPPPLLAEARERVWHIGTFSKTLCPGLRVGWLVAPPRWRKRALRVKHDLDLQSNGLAQSVLEAYLATTDWDARLERLRRFYRRRAARLMESLRRRLPLWRFVAPEGGFSIWVEPNYDSVSDGNEGDDTELLRVAVEHGVSFDPGKSFRAGGGPRPLAVRLCHSLVAEHELDEGVRRLAASWEAFRRRRAKLSVHVARRARVGGRRAAPRVRAVRAR